MAQVNFFCTECSGEIFETSAIPNGSNSFAGAICQDCGHVVTAAESAQFDDNTSDDIADFHLKDLFKP